MNKKKIFLILMCILVVAGLSGCGSKANTSQQKETVVAFEMGKEANQNVDKDIEEKGKKIAINEIKHYFGIDIDDSYDLKVNYFDYGNDSRYYQYLFWNDSNTFDIRVGKGEEKAFYLQQMLPENHDGKLLDEKAAEKLSLNFINEKLKGIKDELALTNTEYEVEKNSNNIEYYVFQYNEKDNENSGAFIKVDCYNKYVTEITLFD